MHLTPSCTGELEGIDHADSLNEVDISIYDPTLRPLLP